VDPLTFTVSELWSALGPAVVFGALLGLVVAWFNAMHG